MPASSKVDLPLAKAESISDGDSATGILYLGTGGRFCTTAIAGEKWNYVSVAALQDTKVIAGEAGGAPGSGGEGALQAVVTITVKQLCPCSACRTLHSGGCMWLTESVSLQEVCIGAGFPAGPVAPFERSPCWSMSAGRTCDPVGGPLQSSLFQRNGTLWKGSMLELFLNYSPWDRFTLERFGGLSPVGGTPNCSGERVTVLLLRRES